MIIFIIGIVSAAGLKAYNQSIYNTTKNANQDLTFTFYLVNEYSFPMYNLTIEDNPYVSFTKFDINPGEIKQITATIVGNEEFNSVFKLYGYYMANIGNSHVTHNINIYSTGSGSVEVDKCDFTAIIGDNAIWTNSVNAPMKLTRDLPTGIEITTVPINGTFSDSILFSSSGTLTYWFLRSGMYWHPCTITILNSSGLVHDPLLDTNISLNIKINYNPTTIGYTVLNKNYTINVFDSKSEGMLITNTGGAVAKKIHLGGEWFSFNDNDFDINVGQTKAITYTIIPVISKTNDTNKDYVKTLTISGNFNTMSENFYIYVPYMSLENALTTSSYGTLMDMIRQWCDEHPQESFCSNQSKIIYVGNGTDASFNVTFGAGQVRGIFDYMFKTGDNLDTLGNYIKEHFDNQGNYLDLLANKSINIDARLTTLEERQTNQSSVMIFSFIAGSLLLFCGMTGTIIYLVKIKNRKRDFKRF